ncbi:MAG: hypothetical protein KGK01_07855 [Bradyrhizobium sp.]|uniref:hypothetical protein n=1 Tax=Bradyrhizobium sp. TaxID=376 RepID=UPI001C29AADB|nr:hypothetical protein [Bradyrhizobium sp.]MBU6463416.1 hypothetical protein [Pseudomonadota bacterium]MDE2067096.1 hypothetical protein [Bradyrhizobium sp.]MDE2242343.1 hypothetical protein [Bradyrhizobium sp.]MDE2468762.1 hypothetical protein [Bradyrhizobium sp.]
MWKQLWRKWTIDKPADFGDLLWQVFVVQLAAFLNRLTFRHVIALIPIVVLAVAYHHNVPLPPELMLVGDFLAYIDIFSVILLVSLLGRASTILYVVRRAADIMLRLASKLRRPDFRHRRLPGARTIRRLISGAKNDDDHPLPVYGISWA